MPDCTKIPSEFLPTRESLLSRLKDCSAEAPWREFFETYWKLIFNLARRSGLTDSEAEDVVQEVMFAVSRHIQSFRYDPARGSFKAWLMVITSRKITDVFRKRPRREVESIVLTLEEDHCFEQVWEEEWHKNLLDEAMRRVKARVSPKSFQAYSLCVLQQRGPRSTSKVLRMSLPAVYMVSHKLNKQVAREIKRLEKEGF